VTRALEDAALLRLQGEDVAGLAQVVGRRVRVDRDLDGPCPVVGRDPGRHALGSLDRDCERGLEGRLVLRGHQVQAELLAALLGQRQADEPARLLGHEVDRLGRRELGGQDEVPLVLAVLAVANDDHLPAAHVLEGFLDGAEVTACDLLRFASGGRRVFGGLAHCDSFVDSRRST
jgi:hypothetical protein